MREFLESLPSETARRLETLYYAGRDHDTDLSGLHQYLKNGHEDEPATNLYERVPLDECLRAGLQLLQELGINPNASWHLPQKARRRSAPATRQPRRVIAGAPPAMEQTLLPSTLTYSRLQLSAPQEQPWHSLVETTPEEAAELVERALKRHARLTAFGIGIFDEERRRKEARGSAAALAILDADFQRERAELATRLVQVAACADWIKKQDLIRSFNNEHTSYGYKHAVEAWISLRGGPHLYVANGAFIAAALGLGLDVKTTIGSANAIFKFSKRTVKKRELPVVTG